MFGRGEGRVPQLSRRTIDNWMDKLNDTLLSLVLECMQSSLEGKASRVYRVQHTQGNTVILYAPVGKDGKLKSSVVVVVIVIHSQR
jgi:hypothetical protein